MDYDHVLIGSVDLFDEINKSLVEKYSISEDEIDSLEILKYRVLLA